MYASGIHGPPALMPGFSLDGDAAPQDARKGELSDTTKKMRVCLHGSHW
jgi:hypothetical protein